MRFTLSNWGRVSETTVQSISLSIPETQGGFCMLWDVDRQLLLRDHVISAVGITNLTEAIAAFIATADIDAGLSDLHVWELVARLEIGIPGFIVESLPDTSDDFPF